MQPDTTDPVDDLIDRPISEANRSQAEQVPLTMQRNTSRRSLIEPSRRGEDLIEPLPRQSRPTNPIRPPVPVEPLARIVEEIPPSVGL